MDKGKLYLIPAPLSDSQDQFILESQQKLIENLKDFIVETPKIGRSFLKKLGLKSEIFNLNINNYDKNSKKADLPELLKPLFEGRDVGYITDAGLPAIADPGSEIVYLAHRNEIKVIPLIGGSSIVLALEASGLNGQSFAFNGYLPVEQAKKQRAIRELEKRAIKFDQTQIFMETPYRAHHMLRDILEVCGEKTLLALAVDLTSPNQLIKTLSIAEWKNVKIDLNKRHVIFLLGRSMV